jgi:hypothetical protein
MRLDGGSRTVATAMAAALVAALTLLAAVHLLVCPSAPTLGQRPSAVSAGASTAAREMPTAVAGCSQLADPHAGDHDDCCLHGGCTLAVLRAEGQPCTAHLPPLSWGQAPAAAARESSQTSPPIHVDTPPVGVPCHVLNCVSRT